MQSTRRILACAAAVLGVSISAGAAPCKNHYILDEPCEMSVAWRPAANLLSSHGPEYTATRLADGRVLVVGGVPDGHYEAATRSWVVDSLPASAEIYDPATDKWSLTAPTHLQRWGHTATLLGDGRVLVVGGGALVIDGMIDWTNESELRRSAEIFDPATNSWSVAGSLAFPRGGHTATLLPTGEVLVVGGQWLEMAVAASELFNPATGQWRVAASPAEPRWSHTATALPDGRVMIVGGIPEFYGYTQAQRAEIFDPVTAQWSSAGSVLPRVMHSATSLQDGRVLIAGGINYRSWLEITLDSVQIYDWRTGGWSEAEPMEHARFRHLAAPFSGNSVLMAGGFWGLSPQQMDRDEVFADYSGAWRDLVSSGEALRANSVTSLADGSLLFIFGNRAAILK